MREAGIRRALWAIVLLGWPVVVIVRSTLHPRWGIELSGGGASLSAMCTLALLVTGGGWRQAHGRHSAVSLLSARVAEHERRLDDQEAAWDTWRAVHGRGAAALRMIKGGREGA